MANASTLSAPVLYTFSDLISDASLVTKITHLINDAFSRSKKPEPRKWGEHPRDRFPSNDVYLETIGSEGIVAVIFDESTSDRKVVAVSGAIPWQGGWKQKGAGVEEGWEIKAVAVDGEAQYLRRGLAVQLCAFLEQQLVLKSKALGISTNGRQFNDNDQVSLWIIAAECINGVYWRKRGYELVRKELVDAPTWGAYTSFEIVVLRKDVPFESLKNKAAMIPVTKGDTLVVQEVEVK
ncbi:hypothetical protein C7974DRAFT_214390 [Boeremia exigua]|uniref:uncharacterized protein n=1 Tax=Boeremia exigua TaxID=749465 RepID=UPI001E8D34AC|nr:uncharacterized protein C7974DRAFT_214390 [Boeremia exigua]KAH6621996.1 hypothetical protein C7974DRAFT_214390 [Boeremia exigua]